MLKLVRIEYFVTSVSLRPDGPDVRMITDEVDTVVLTMDHIHCPVRGPRIPDHNVQESVYQPMRGLREFDQSEAR